MSALVLREAAARIRKDQGIEMMLGHIAEHECDTWTAVATWLEACASVLDVSPNATKAHALTVARAYLGELA
jgi:hypothetical protein